MQPVFTSRVSKYKNLDEVSQLLLNTYLTHSLHLFSSALNDIRYCTAPGANL